MIRLLLILIALATPLVILFHVFKTPDTDPDAMRAKYGGAAARYVETPDGLSIHYRDEGNRQARAIVLIHGNSASLHTWEKLSRRLGDDYRIISYDQPGHGLTGPAPDEDYSAAGLMRALDAVVEAAGLDSFVLGGSSMGGWVAWRYALENPARVDALLLIDAAGAPADPAEAPPPSNLGFRLVQNPLGRYLLQRITPRRLVEKSIRETVSVETIVNDAYVDRHWELLRYPGNRRAAALRPLVDREPAMAERLSDIAAPSLIVWGAEDRLTPASGAQYFDRKIPSSELFILNGVGHLPMEEAPDLTADAVRGFLADYFAAPARVKELEGTP